jgi:hypothetical protein
MGGAGRMNPRRALLGLIVFAAAGQSPWAGAAGSIPEVTMSTENQARMGVTVSTLERRSRADVVHAYVRAVDIVPLLALASDLQAARAALDVSEAELSRLATLASQAQSASARDVESARSAAAAAGSRLSLLRRRLRVEWSTDLAGEVEQSEGLVESLSQGETVLLRADAPTRPAGVVGQVVINAGKDRAPLVAEPIGRSGTIDARMQTIGLYALLRSGGADRVRPGGVFEGEIRTSDVSQGFLLPRASVVRIDGSSWVYVQTGTTTFQRRALSGARPVPEGWFVSDHFQEGDIVAVSGAESLLAVEGAPESSAPD